jgi:pimeloyl-ACP methyl ester carboxylesterase
VGTWLPSSRQLPPPRRPFFGRDDKRLRLELLTLDTEDGHRWDGILYLPPGAGGRRTVARPAVVVVHGSIGNFLSGVPRALSFGLAQAGHPVLSINTRMANYGVIFGGGLLQRTPLDIDPAVAMLRRRGYDRIVLLGYSMGATMVTNYQALRDAPEVVGLCTVAHPLSLPDSLRLRWARHGASPSYEEIERRARELLMPDPERSRNDEIFVVNRARGFTDEPSDAEVWTYRTWWFSRGPEAVQAISARRIGGVTVPVGMMQAGADSLVLADEGDELARIALAGSCPDARVTVIEGADHVFSGKDRELIDACAAWIDHATAGRPGAGPSAPPPARAGGPARPRAPAPRR